MEKTIKAGNSEIRMEVGKFGVNESGVEAKLIWTEEKSGNVAIGYGLNADTGMKSSGNGVDASCLGFGFKVGDCGSGIKTPLFSFSWK